MIFQGHAVPCFLAAQGGRRPSRQVRPAPWTERSDAETAGCFNLQSVALSRRAHEYMAVRLCIEVRPWFPRDFVPVQFADKLELLFPQIVYFVWKQIYVIAQNGYIFFINHNRNIEIISTIINSVQFSISV